MHATLGPTDDQLPPTSPLNASPVDLAQARVSNGLYGTGGKQYVMIS
jgi:hypothetical protein